MSTYYAITRRNGRWQYVYSGLNPEDVYRQAVQILEGQYYYPGEEGTLLSPSSEQQLSTLQVVPEEIARSKFHVVFSRASVED